MNEIHSKLIELNNLIKKENADIDHRNTDSSASKENKDPSILSPIFKIISIFGYNFQKIFLDTISETI